MPSDCITVLIAEDEAITRFGLKYALHTFADVRVVAECPDGVSTILQALATHPNVILMDIGLPKVDGITASFKIKEALPKTKIIVFTCSEDKDDITRSFEAGVDGYCLKKVSGEHLYAAIKAVLAGETWMDPDLGEHVSLLKQLHQSSIIKDSGSLLNILQDTADPSRSHIGALHVHSEPDTTSGTSGYENKDSELPLDEQDINYCPLLNSNAGLSEEQLREQRASGANRTIIAERYQVEKVLGKGGMGMVYKGRHIYMNRAVAIKILHPEQSRDPAVVSRFRKEARSLCQFSHPNLVGVFDFGVMSTGEPFMVMDYCDGQSLDKILHKTGKLSVKRGLFIFEQVCRALEAVHNQGIIHRDVKPSNILVGADDAIKLVDFGLAKSLGGLEHLIKLTCTGEVVGSPSYMSPEQCTGQELDHKSDIYSLGISMFEAFTGEMPFQADSFYELLNKHIRGTPSRDPFIKNNLPRDLEEVIFRCLDKNPEGRFQSARELLQALESVEQSLTTEIKH
ncbi:MAG: Non-specific serine/threonine protein kinase [Cyanobacteriota bacterium erpe_2018_sw_39hr_WHONDRS-SW48-000098_B_bin.30]|jgi:DNA-binding NarL/FixJ family response regulator/tRNA A-37 threonylcarbamoyl transferase component Bud32|nr:protein kinase [Candidatus Obscuribacter sp.]MBK7837594.1 protein kinase [Candidatus Obscuribacter sp.]MDQ5965815.1 Non-specific serine/threonine protein kinase [Cyanobacteriota bacterium erpe_2018_sw_39hr_WHONDRS-SW48-000098_B_bin.30]